MECSKCNHKINPGQEVCLSCGHILRYESENSKKCFHCNRSIPVSYKKCPYCKKKQTSRKIYLIVIFILSIILLDKYIIDNIYDFNVNNIIDTYEEVSYEELVKKNIYYDESFIKITGKVISVDSVSYFFNKIKINLYTDDDESHQLEIIYKNKPSIGFITNDEIVIYGKMKKLDGNKPVIYASIIEFNAN